MTTKPKPHLFFDEIEAEFRADGKVWEALGVYSRNLISRDELAERLEFLLVQAKTRASKAAVLRDIAAQRDAG